MLAKWMERGKADGQGQGELHEDIARKGRNRKNIREMNMKKIVEKCVIRWIIQLVLAPLVQ